MSSMSTLQVPSTTVEQISPTTVRHALAEDLKEVVDALRAGSLPSTDACLQQLRMVVSRTQRSEDLATSSATLSSSYTAEELKAAYSLTRERLGLAVVDIKSAEVRNAEVGKALLHTQRKAETVEAVVQSVSSSIFRFLSDRVQSRKAEAAEAVGRSTGSSTFRILSGRVQPQSSAEPLQQATADGQSAVVPISDMGGRRKHAVRSPNEGVAALTHAAKRDEEAASTRTTRALEFDPAMTRVAYTAGLSMLCVLMLSTLYSAGVIGFIFGLGTALEGEAMTLSAKNRAGCLVCVASCAVAVGILFSVAAWKLMLPHQRRHPMTLLRMLASCWTFPLLAVVVVVVVLVTTHAAQRSVPGEWVGGLIIMMCTLTTVHMHGEGMHRYRQDSLVRARRTAVTIESAASSDSEVTTASVTERLASEAQKKKKSSWWGDMILIVKIAFPQLMVFGMGFVYILGIFRLGDAAKAVAGGPEAVLLLALLVKMVGNKLQLLLLRNLSKVPVWISNISVFAYEYVTALLVRMLLLSIPSESTAIYLSLLSAALEMMTRAWFCVGYISTGGKQLAGLECDNSTHHRAYVRRGQLRVLDGCNDAMVEYMTLLGAAAVAGILPATEAFALPTDEKMAFDSLLRVLGVQIAAELVVDTFVFALEAKGGLVPLQLQYWKGMSLGVVCIQLCMGIAETTFVLGALLLEVS
jgi:hypothetical protein